MKLRLLAILACPSCGGGFAATAATREADDVIEGSLACDGCNAASPIR